MRWMTGVQFPAGAMMGFLYLHHCIYTASGACSASYPMGTRDFYPIGKVLGHEAEPLFSI